MSPWKEYQADCERVRSRLRALGLAGDDVWELADSAAARLGARDSKSVIARMVADGVLVPCKVDLACADPSAKAFAGLQSKARHIEQSPWCTAYALFWTYEPSNRTPMLEPNTKEKQT